MVLLTNQEQYQLQFYSDTERIFLECAIYIIRIELIKFICKK